MKKLCTLILILLATASATLARDPDGFRDLPWGAELAKLADRGFERVPVPKGVTVQVESFRRKNDDLTFHGVTSEAITYNFLGGRLYSVTVDFTGSQSLKRLTDYCRKRFGRSSGSMVKEMEYFDSFESPTTGALIYYQFAKHSFFVRYGRLFLYSREMDRELK
jgi:hypothetical protein